MKKIIALVLCTVLLLVACGTSVKDGTYRAEVSDAVAEANYGWREYMEVTYKDGKIADVDFNAVDPDGNLKSDTTAETYPMDPHPSEWIPQIVENIKAAGTSTKLDTIAGVTNSSESSKKLLAAIEAAALEGNTETSIVE